MSAAKWNLLVDVEKCTGCRNCYIAVKDEYVGNNAQGYFASQPANDATWFRVEHHERGQVPFTRVTYVPVGCQHCDDAPCMKAAKDGAVTKRPDGIAVIDPVKSKGQRRIMAACPYDAICWNEELDIPQAWPFDAHLMDQGWTRTRVEQVCPTGALRSVKATDKEIERLTREGGYGPIEPRFKTKPRLHYRGLDRLRAVFVAGSVQTETSGRRECFEGARVSLLRGDEFLAETRTNGFGDFALDVQAGGAGRLRIEADGVTAYEAAIELSAPVSLGTILLK